MTAPNHSSSPRWSALEPTADAFRLAASLRAYTQDRSKVVIVSGAFAHEGTSTLVSHLAHALALQEKQVLVVDANLRRPSQNETFGTSLEPGLAEYLTGKSSFDDVVHETLYPSLLVLPAGHVQTNPVELLSGDRVPEMMATFRDQFNITLIDTPPLLDSPDAAVLGGYVDCAITVLREGKRRRAEAQEMVRILQGINVPIVGAVLTRGER